MAKLITHPGQAHRDDFISCCLLLAAKPTIGHIFRREPTLVEMDDMTCYVVDVGRQDSPEFRLFDHHQLPRDAAPTCALSLVLKHLGLADAARAASTWIEFTEVLDSKGPKAVQARYGMTDEAFYATLSPIEAQLLIMFGNHQEVRVGDPLYELMTVLGQQWLSYWRKFDGRIKELRDGHHLHTLGERSLLVDLPTEDEPHLALEAYLRNVDSEFAKVYPDRGQRFDVTITRDDRGPGWCLYRRNDAPGVDFSRLTDHPLVTFAHNGGFVAKTVDCSRDELAQLVQIACGVRPAAAAAT